MIDFLLRLLFSVYCAKISALFFSRIRLVPLFFLSGFFNSFGAPPLWPRLLFNQKRFLQLVSAAFVFSSLFEESHLCLYAAEPASGKICFCVPSFSMGFLSDLLLLGLDSES